MQISENPVHRLRLVAAVGVALALAGPASALDIEMQVKLGEHEYMSSCAACHGADGKGSGPVAEVLSQAPSDLTTIAARYSGSFPADQIYRVISGQDMINPHGDRQMPVWGPRYWQSAQDRAGMVPHDVDTQALVHGRIMALVQYLESIQSE